MRSEADKFEIEREVFLRFIEIAELPIDAASIEKRLPPEPDLRCIHQAEGEVAFELVEMCDPRVAQAISEESEAYIRTADPSPLIIAKKLRREYETEVPIELLCYTNNRIITPDSHILLAISPYLRSYRHIFRRAWLLGRKGAYLVWSQG